MLLTFCTLMVDGPFIAVENLKATDALEYFMLGSIRPYVLTIFPMRIVQQWGNRNLLIHPLPCAFLRPKRLECCTTKLIHKPFSLKP